MTNREMIDRVIAREGGFVNDPLDSGGATNMGITLATLAGHRNTTVTPEDVQKLTKDEARDIYEALYLVGPGIDKIEDPLLRELVFDSAVQHGVGNAVRFLQRALPLVSDLIDGVLGPATLSALSDASQYAVRRRTWGERALFYATILKKRPDQKRFAGGWFIRLSEFAP